jgi:hypothetical protein
MMNKLGRNKKTERRWWTTYNRPDNW